MYKCDCGKEFETAQKFNSHKSHCKVHLGPEKWFLHCCRLKKMSKIANAKKREKILAKQNLELDTWIAEQHKCEHCGKIMTEKFGSGRFCSRSCANSHKISPEQKAKVSQTLKYYTATHHWTEKQQSNFKQLGKYIRPVKPAQYALCAYCGKLIDISKKKSNKTGRYYCNGTCRNRHLNKLKEIGGINQGYNTSKWELDFQSLLTKYNINFEANKRDLLPSGLEIDIWLPDYKIAIELNGIYHYSIKPYAGNIEKFKARLQKDTKKRQELKDLGYTYYIFEDRNIKDYISFFEDFIQMKLLKK